LSKNTPKNKPARVDSVPTIDAFNTWVLLDYTKFSVSRLRDIELAGLGLTAEQTAILRILSKYGSSTIAEIADKWMRQHHSVSTLINRMAEQGMVEKIKHPKQKEVEVRITEKGISLYNRVTPHSIEMVFSALSQDDLQKLSQYLKLLYIRSRGLLGINGTPPFLL
jgi:DNA-binding MarR family transcriptional regulator